jgi:site-specific DNA-methyltransferase (adenine-specific)
MGFDYVGCELDKEYFDKGCERFNRECLGETKTKDGRVITQLQLFDM